MKPFSVYLILPHPHDLLRRFSRFFGFLSKREIAGLVLLALCGIAGWSVHAVQTHFGQAPSALWVRADTSFCASRPVKDSLRSSEKDGLVHINAATSAEIEALNGIGPKLAQRIVAYRNLHGPFQSKKELLRVKGIGPKKFEKIKNDISLNEPAPQMPE